MKFMTLAFLLLAPPAFARTWSSSGGGSGVACFRTDADADRYRATGILDQPLIDALLKVDMLDIWENPLNSYVSAEPGENADAYLRRVLQVRLADTAPHFYQLLLKALAQVDVRRAQPTARLPHVPDTGTITQWYPETHIGPRLLSQDPVKMIPQCVLVQVARRTLTREGGRLHVHLAFDPQLYDLLGLGQFQQQTMDRAAFNLHEALYILGAEIGQITSENSRRLTAVLLSNDKFNAFLQAAEEHAKRFPDSDLRGNYMREELQADGFGPLAVAGQKRNPRMAAALNSYQEKRDAVGRAEIAGDEEGNTRKLIGWYDDMGPEESFFAVAYLCLAHGVITDFTNLIDPKAPLHRSETAAVCARARDDKDQEDPSVPDLAAAHARMVDKVLSLSLCRGLR